VACNLANVPLKNILKYVFPFIVASTIALIAISVWPDLSLFIPRLAARMRG
jgi:TRAP-type C4-dicarboxylate transport system permease large subunit